MFVGRRLDQHMVLFLKFLRPLLAQRSQLLQLKPFDSYLAADSLSFFNRPSSENTFSVAFSLIWHVLRIIRSAWSGLLVFL